MTSMQGGEPDGLRDAPARGIALDRVTRRYAGVAALDGVTLDIRPGEFFVVLGPSGCGKSTLLRTIAGLDRPDAGSVHVDGRRVVGPGTFVPPEERGIGVVFQSYALWPHMTVAEQVGFPAEVAGLRGAARDELVRGTLARVSLEALAARRPDALSGGQRQRVALARCLAQGARTILMDEPLANLDPHLRARMEDEIRAFHREAGATTLYITHDQREAMALADRVAMLDAGRLLQVAAPDELYARPADERVARFVGEGSVVDVDALGPVEGGRVQVRFAGRAFSARAAGSVAAGRARLLLRPESVRLEPVAGPACWPGRVASSVYRGGYRDVRVAIDGGPVLLARDARALAPGTAVGVAIDDGWVIPPITVSALSPPTAPSRAAPGGRASSART